ncbi:MAG: hypothetical protein IT350_17645 [Deltaproteobacteria bacterium]|nr:hypothetical protein [Deltaproteobacteria bacterium]
MSHHPSKPSVLDPMLVVVAIVSATLIFPFAFAPLTREASLTALNGSALVRGTHDVSNCVMDGEVGAALLAAATLTFGPERPAETLAAAFALWHWMTSLFLYLAARKVFSKGGALAALVYAATIVAGGARSVFSPVALAALPVVLALEFAAADRKAARVGFGFFVGVGIAFARETVVVVSAYAYDQFRRNADRPNDERNRFGAWELAGVLAGLCAVIALAGQGRDTFEALRAIVAAHSRAAFAPFDRMLTSALVLVAVATWIALGAKTAAEASSRRLVAGGAIALWLASCTRPPVDLAALLPLAGLGALAVAGAYSALMRTAPFSRATRWSAPLICAGILIASPLPGAIRSVEFIGPYLRGEDVVTYHGRFFEHATDFDAALMVDAANWIAGNTGENDVVAGWGSEPGLFLYSERAAMCGFTTIVPILEGRPGEEGRFARCLADERPRVIAAVRNPRNWSGGFTLSRGYGISQPEVIRSVIRKEYRGVQRVGGFDLYLRNDLSPKHVPLATIYELNVPREP